MRFNMNPMLYSPLYRTRYQVQVKMPRTNYNDVIVGFSKLPADRDHLRNCLSENTDAVVCFEKEAICFDNLRSIQPSMIVAKTDSDDTAWRFIFALNALGLNSSILLVSDVIDQTKFESDETVVPVYCFSNSMFNNGISKRIRGILEGNYKVKKGGSPFIIGQNSAIKNIRNMVPSLAHSIEPILITGEQGTGKKLLAEQVVRTSDDAQSFVTFNCVDFSTETLAKYRATGKICSSGDGCGLTVLLENIHLLRETSQAELLLLLDQPEKWIGGALLDNEASIRLIATSTEKLDTLVKKNIFRKDLYYRLNVIPITMPSLRSRLDDLPMLMDFFIIDACAKQQKSVFMLSDRLKASLRLYKWPGNVGELKTMMFRIASKGDESCVYSNDNIPKTQKNSREQLFGKIDEYALPNIIEIQKYLPTLKTLSLKNICDEFVSRTEKRIIQKALESTSWNRKKGAALLNISYKSMLNKMKMYEIS